MGVQDDLYVVFLGDEPFATTTSEWAAWDVVDCSLDYSWPDYEERKARFTVHVFGNQGECKRLVGESS
jgi:hypothetical protein